ncbi:MAG: hypothetical protein ACKON7_11255 [Planctomycetaceae bacterium]
MGSARHARPLLVLVAVLCGCGPARPPATPSTAASRTGAAAAPRVRVTAAGGPREITFDDIKLDMEKGAAFTPDLLPERVTALDGTRIRVRGYILPSFQQSGLTQFVLVRDNMECCFGPGAALHDCIVVRMVPGRAADFSIRPVAVAGTFRLDELKGPDGRHLAIYALEGEEVR